MPTLPFFGKLKYIVLFALPMVLIVGCGSTGTLMMRTWEPAPVALTKEIKRIGIINESNSFIEKAGLSKLEQLVALRDEKLAQQGIIAAIQAVQTELQKDRLVDTVLVLDRIPEFTHNAGTMESSVPWDHIEHICEVYDLDAIFSLSSYETDTRVSLKKSTMEDTDLLRVKIMVPAQEITLETLLENGWRIYDPVHRLILDELTFSENFTTSATGVNPVRALQAVTGRQDSLLHQSMRNGSEYGLRLQPFSKNVYRKYYVKGASEFEEAHKLVSAGDLQGAAALWEKGSGHKSNRVRGRAFYNMAVYHEYEGNLEAAIDWASRAYDSYSCNSIAQYIEILGHRKTQDRLLQEQLAARLVPISESK